MRYVLDAKDRLLELSPEWTPFALENDAPELAADKVRGRLIWDFLADRTTCRILAALFDRARRGYPVGYTFRCDAPASRRLFSMSISSLAPGTLTLETDVVLIEKREEPMPLLERAGPRGEQHLRMCSWCKRVADEKGGWVEVEQAVRDRNLFHEERLPELTHGICPTCLETMLSKLDEKEAEQVRRAYENDAG